MQSKTRSRRKRFFQPYQETSEQQKKERREQNRLNRWKLQATARRLLPGEAVAKCFHAPIPKRHEIEVYEHHEKEEAKHFYAGLQICGSVWTCPICAAKITEKRRQELISAIREADRQGLYIYMATFTFSHQHDEPLAETLPRYKDARNALKSGRKAKDFKAKHTIVGTIEVLEVKYGHNGWHPHSHELIFTEKPLDTEQFEQEHRKQWEHQAARHGLTMNAHGYKLDKTRGAIADYIAKWGHEPQNPRSVWGVEAEMSKGHLKKGKDKTDKHLTPFGILQEITDGNTELEPLFIEYARCFKGRHQMQWTPQLKKRLLIEEKTDKELAEEQTEQAEPILAFDIPTWKIVIANDFKGELLELPTAHDMKQALIDLGANPAAIRIRESTRGGNHNVMIEPMDTDAELPPTSWRIAQQTPLAPEQLAERMRHYQVIYLPEKRCKCGCELWRPVLGELECCRCSPHPLWPNSYDEKIKALYS